MTRLDLQNRILDQLNESVTSPVFWTTAQIDDLITEGSELLAEEAKLVKRSVTVTVRDGTSYYQTRSLAPDIMAITRLTLPDNRIRLRAISPSEIDAFNMTWETTTGVPRWWAPIDWDTFAVFPHAVTGGPLMCVDYLAWPRPLLDDTDSPEYQEDEQDAVILYGVYAGLMKRWDVGRALSLWGGFMECAGKSRASTGMDMEDGRTWQMAAEPGVPFMSGLNSGWY